ncbi:MAG: L-arabinose ABC transporter permease AraH [Opitutia bacterium]|nr:L-arabinose ABC transporter permease AraH [Opitutaceae bacterium]PHX70631.1 MAG: L-arabinose ABC transporter permease AraH [Opitutae bacterium]
MATAASSTPRKPIAEFFDQAGMLVVLAILFIGCSAFVENFLSWRNMQGLALAVSMTGMVACTMLFCLAAGDFDLSIGSVVACAGVLAAVVMNKSESITLGVAAGLGIGALVGVANGYVVAKLRINALITTLATMQIVRGFGFIISDGKAVGIGVEDFFSLGSSALFGVPTPVWITAVCFAIFGFILNRTVFGRDTLAVGGNSEASHLAGIAVDRVKIIIFTAQGVMAAFAGIVLASRITSGQPNTSQGFELEVISACVLGGVSLTGGVGSMAFVIAGVLIMGIVQNAMNLLNVATFYQYVARGLILLAAVLFDRWKRRRA